eukprot:7526775-Pyramimonas_sp.AAC.1
MERHQELHGTREPPDEMKASIHAHLYEQVRQVPRLEGIMQLYEVSTDRHGRGMRSYEWLVWQIELSMMRDREKWAISEHGSALNSSNRQARLGGGGNGEGGGGGRRASATVATVDRPGLPTYKTASRRTKGDTTCRHANQGKMPRGRA